MQYSAEERNFIMVDGVNNVHFSGEDPKKKKLAEPLPLAPLEINLVSDEKLKEDMMLKGISIERIEPDGPDIVENKDDRKKAIKMQRKAIREDLDVSRRAAKRLAKNDIMSAVAEEVVNRSTYYIDEEAYNKAVAQDPDGHHVLLDEKYKKVLNQRLFDSAFEGRQRDKKGNLINEGTLNSDKLKQMAIDLVGDDDYKLDLDENKAGAAMAGLTNKKGNVRRKDARILRHMFRDMGFAYEKDKTAAKRALAVGKAAAMGAASGALVGPVVSEITGWLGLSGTVGGVVSGFVTGQVSGKVAGFVEGQISGKADYAGTADYKADYSGSVDYSGSADYSGSVDYSGSADYSGSVDYSGQTGFSGSADYSGSVDYSGHIPVRQAFPAVQIIPVA